MPIKIPNNLPARLTLESEGVMVMTEDQTLRHARLSLVAALRDLILGIADLSEIATER